LLIYRLTDWIYKVTMYPNIFFSIITIFNYKDSNILVDSNLRYLSYVASIIIITIYLLEAFIYIIFEEISLYSKMDKICEIVFNVITSITIAKTLYEQYNYVLLVIVGRRICHILIEVYLKRGQYREKNVFKLPIILL
jgi:hypothetical protein